METSTHERQNILVVEDDPDISELVQYNLEKDGYCVHTASNGEDGLVLAQQFHPSLVILDIMLPGMSGLKICSKLRENPATRSLPIIFLTAKGEESDLIIGFEMGADDYISKPFSPKELVARVKAVLRRGLDSSTSSSPQAIEVGPISIDHDKHQIMHAGKPLNLTLAEFNLLSLLASKPGHVFTREKILEKVSGHGTYVVDRNVDVHIRSIRKKLGEDCHYVETIRGVGYKWIE